MWVQIKSAPNLIVAEMWKELFEGEGLPSRIMVDADKPGAGIAATYRVLVPRDRLHVAKEILRKV